MADAYRNILSFDVGSSSVSLANFTLNQSTDFLEFVIQLPEDSTITGILLRQGTLTGTAPVFRVSLQGVDASGNPDGTIKGGSTCYVDYTPTTGNNNTVQRLALGASYAGVRGEMLSIVVAYQSGTIDVSNSCSFTVTNAAGITPGIPYGIQNDAGTRTRQGACANIGWYTASKIYGRCIESAPSAAFSSASTPDERGLYFTLPSGWGSTYQLVGMRWLGAMAATGAYDIVLYSGTTVLQSVSMDTDADQSPTATRIRTVYFDETTLSTLSYGTPYRLVIKPTTGTITTYEYVMDAAGDMDSWPLGTNVYYTSRTDAGAFSEDTTKRNSIEALIFADTTVAASGGASSYAFFS